MDSLSSISGKKDIKDISERDRKADNAIKTMLGAIVLAAAAPAQVNWALISTAMGAGVVAIGVCYDVKLTKDEAWKLVKQFFSAAGAMFIALNVGNKIITGLLASTGVGYVGAVAIDSIVYGASAYAIGSCAKEYFRRDYCNKSKLTKEELGQIFREAFSKKKKDLKENQ